VTRRRSPGASADEVAAAIEPPAQAFPRHPRQLAASIILMAAWIAFLAWMACT
jgi:hypothetical protein